MHYKNGREAKEGDPVIAKVYNGFRAGTISQLNPNATTCNGTLTRAIVGGVQSESVNLGELYHAEDAFAAIEVSTELAKAQNAAAGR
jgi:hypothetical protein